ncbi:hypothetical protein F4826_004783 [Rahnella inusitata]|nr:hypothetical protein [Rahnella inusitata]
MASKKEHIQFRFDEEPSELLLAEAKRLGCGKNEAARYLLQRALLTTDNRVDSHLRLSATTAFQLANFVVEIFKQFHPGLTEAEVVKKANEAVFTPSRTKADEYLKTLGVER